MIGGVCPESHRAAGTLDLNQVKEAVIRLDEKVGDVIDVDLALAEHLDKVATEDPVVSWKKQGR